MIDLKEVITKYPECLENSEKLKAYLTDLYPSEKAKVSIIVAIFNSGIADEIKKSSNIDEIDITRYCNKLENNFGFSQRLSIECLRIWLDTYEKFVNNTHMILNSDNNSYNQNSTNDVLNYKKNIDFKDVHSQNSNDNKLFPQKYDWQWQYWKDIIQISASDYLLGLKSDGTVLSSNFREKAGHNIGPGDVSGWTDIVEVSTCGSYSLGLKKDGTVVAAGNNDYGQCNVSQWNNIVKISTGVYHSLGLKKDGTVVSTGKNNFGQCNISNWKDITDISAGYEYSLGLKSNGTVIAVGNNEFGQCKTSRFWHGWENIVSICSSGFQSFGVKSDGTILISPQDDFANKILKHTLHCNIVSISVYSFLFMGLLSNGKVVCIRPDSTRSLSFLGNMDVSHWNNIVSICANLPPFGLKSDGTVVSI